MAIICSNVGIEAGSELCEYCVTRKSCGAYKKANNNQDSKTNKEYKIFIDTKEFQQKILDYINSEEIDKMIRSTIFDGKPECRSAIIHGMCMASMLTSYCEPFCIIENGK